MKEQKNIFSSIGLKRAVAILLVIVLTFSSLDVSGFFGVAQYSHANEVQSTSSGTSAGIASDSNTTGNTQQTGRSSTESLTNTQSSTPTEGSLSDGVLENDLLMGSRLRSGALRSRPDASQLQTVDHFLIQNTADGIIIWGFEDGYSVEDLVIPDSLLADGVQTNVVEIGADAFAQTGLKTLIIGENVKKIGENAFSANELEVLLLPDNLETVEKDAFRDNKITDLNLNKVKTVGDTAFANNLLTSLNLGSAIEELGADSFRNNDLTEVHFPATLMTVGTGAFTYNNRYVKVTTDLNPLPAGVPAKDTAEGGYGYVMNPISITIVHRDAVTGEKISTDVVLSSDLTSTNDIYVLDMPQSYTPPQVQNYTPVSDPVHFTPDTDGYVLEVLYNKTVSTIFLVRDTTKQPTVGPFTPASTDDEVRTALLSLVKATDGNNADLSADVVFGDPSVLQTVKNAAQGTTVEVEYILRNNQGEEKRLKLDVLIGTDMRNFPLRDGWVLGDFIYGGDPGTNITSVLSNSVIGFSPQGMAKVNSGKINVVLPHINPTNGQPITRVGTGGIPNINASVGTPFQRATAIKTVTDFDDNIQTVEASAFQGNKLTGVRLNSATHLRTNAFYQNALTEAILPMVTTIENNVFAQNTDLTEFDLSGVTSIGSYAFSRTGLKKAIAPLAISIGSAAFENTKIGSDPDYVQGFYFPLVTKINSYMFNNTQLQYVNRNEQMPLVTEIGSAAFNVNNIQSADLTGVTKVESSAFANQRSRALKTLVAPDLQIIGSSAFYFNSLERADLPALTTLQGSVFRDNKITQLSAPNLSTMTNGYNFYNNLLTEVRLPQLQTASGMQDFAYNLIREAYFDNILQNGLGTEIFYTPDFPNNMTSPSARNPGLTSIGNHVAVHTNTSGVPSKENYIVNPTTPEDTPFDEDDFTWDANNPSMVTGLTNKGKAKLVANQNNLVIPPRATIIGERAFHFEGIKSVKAPEVLEIRPYGFSQNPLSSVEMPKVTTIGNSAFADNKARTQEERLLNFDFSHVVSVGNYAFSNSGLSGGIRLPLLREVQTYAFYNNPITHVDAPLLETIRSGGFQNTQLTSVDTTQFPSLTRIESAAFQATRLTRIDLPNLLYSQGSSEFYTYYQTEPLLWEQNSAIVMGNTNKASFSSNTFNYFVPNGKNSRYTMPGGIILTSPRNPDGSLNRTNPNRFTEQVSTGNGYTYNGRTIYPKVRRGVIDPGTVKVNYVIEGSNEVFDGTNGKPNVPGYTEMIFEELEPRVEATGEFASARKYIAPAIPGYVLVSSTDATGSTVALRKELNVPFEPLGQRTDREVTFTYRKLETDLNPSIKLDYFIHQSATAPYELERTYTGSVLNNQQISTEFSLNKIGSSQISLSNAKLIIETDSPYINLDRTVVANDATTSSLYDPSGVVKTPNGVEITLKNTSNFSAVNNVGVNFFFADNLSIPDITHANFRIKLVNEENGVQKVIAESNSLKAIADINVSPTISVSSTPLVVGYPYSNYSTDIDGPRNMGVMETVNGVSKVISNPSPVSYSYTMRQIHYPIDKYTITHVLPTYTAYNPVTGQEETRTAVFDASRNPGWVLSPDGSSVSYVSEVNNPNGGTYSSGHVGKFFMPKLLLTFPDIIEGSPAKSDVFVDVQKTDDPINPVAEPLEHARGDLGIGDSHTIHPLSPRVIVPDGRDYAYRKSDGFTPNYFNNRSVMYDNETDRPKEFHYELALSSTNEALDMKNVSIIDFGLDERLRYKRVEFTQSAASANNFTARVSAYKKTGGVIDPQNDTLLSSRTVPIAPNNSVYLPNDEVDYVKVDIVETENVPLNFHFQFKMVVELKDPTQKLINGSDPNYFINKSYFTSTAMKKGTDEPAFVKPTDPETEHIPANFIMYDDARVEILDYKVTVRAEKSLRENLNASSWETFPDYSSGDAIVGGQGGYYHIRLNSSLLGNPGAKVNSVLNNFELIDVFPEGMNLNEDQIFLTREFELAGGQFEILGSYSTVEDGVNVTRRAIRFYSPALDLSKFATNPMVLARVKTKFMGDVAKEKITNKIYATWTPKEGVEALGVAMSGGNTIGPNGQNSTQPWSYSEVSIRTKVASALSGKLEIRNHRDNLWTSSIKTGSEEAFDYRMTVGQLDANATAATYRNIEMLNIFPGPNDLQLSKSAARNSQFQNTFDTSRPADLKVYISRANGTIDPLSPSSYTVSYINTTNGVDTLLLGKTVDQLSDETGTWVSSPNADTKALKIKMNQDIVLNYGDQIHVEIPMKAPALSGVNDPILDKAAVDSFSLRYTKDANTSPEEYREVNNVQNIMEGKKGTLQFQKRGKIGNTTPDTAATPLPGAVFLLTDLQTNKTQIATSDSDGWVKFTDLDVRHRVQIDEIIAPDGYTLSTRRDFYNLNELLTESNQYTMNLTQSRNIFWMNVKSVIGSIKIVKNSVDPNVQIPNITFRVRGITNTSNYRNTHIDMYVTTGADGTVTLPNIPEGQYYISELPSSESARFTDMENYNVTIQGTSTDITQVFQNRLMELPLRKVITTNQNDLDPDNWDKLTDFQKTRVGGYRFKIVGSNGQTITPTTVTSSNTAQNGEVKLTNLVPGVVYTITEDVNQTTPNAKLYEHNPTAYQFMFTPDGKLVHPDNNRVFRQGAVNFPNVPKRIKGKIVVNKTDNASTPNPVAGAKFDLYQITFANDGSIAGSTKVGTTKVSVMNGAKAEVVFDNLDPGTYQVREIEAAPGYYLGNSANSFIVTIPATASATNLTDARYNFTGNEIIYTHDQAVSNKKATVKAFKGEDLAGKTGITIAEAQNFVAANSQYRYRIVGDNLANVYKPLAGVVFELYKSQNGVKQGSAISVNGNTDIVTDANGELNFGGFMFEENQEYSIFEKTQLAGYERLINPKTFKLANEVTRADFDGTLTLHINNKKMMGSILVSKYDSITRRPIFGAKFRLYAGHGSIPADSSGHIAEIQSGFDGFAHFGNLEIGQYTVREVAAPSGYMAPGDAVRDRKITITSTGLNQSYVAYNTRSRDVRITKTWNGGSEASVQLKLLRKASNETTFSPVVAPVVFGVAPNTTTGNTAADGSITLDAGTGLSVVFPNMPLANDAGREYTYQVQEISVTMADGTVVPVVNNQIGNAANPDYSVLIGGNINDGFTVQNIAFDSNKRSVMVNKTWKFADGSTTPPPGTKIVIALMKKIGSAAEVETERKTLDASNHWTHTFTNLEKRSGGQEVTYSVREISTTDGLINTVTEDVSQRTANSNVFKISNIAVKRSKITFTKNWVGVDPASAPSVVLELYDSENMSTPMFTQAVTRQADGTYRAIFTDVPSFAYTVEPNALLADNDPNKGRLVARKIKYVAKEKYADNQTRPGYTFVSTLTDAQFATYGADANIGNDLSFTVTNTMEKVNFKVNKNWVGVDPSNAPSVQVRLLDVTADTTPDQSDTSAHITVDTKTLAYNTDATLSFTADFNNLPKYKPDGSTLIKYKVVELTNMNGYTSEIGPITEVDASQRRVVITNTRKTRELLVKKQWNLAVANYMGATQNTPEVVFDIWADTTDDNVINPAPYTQTGVVTSNLTLNTANSYERTISGLHQYSSDGSYEIKYYAKERPITGYTLPVDAGTDSADARTGRISLSENASGQLAGTFINRQEMITLNAVVNWRDLNMYTPTERQNLPVPNIDVYDYTDPANPKLVRENVPMVLVEDTNTPNRARWTASMPNLPKYTADGQKAIVYQAVQRQSYNGYTTTQVTNPYDSNGSVVNIRDADGSLITDTPTLNARLANASVWNAEIVNTPKKRDIVVKKIWEGKVGTSASVYLLKNNQRTAPVAGDTNVTPVVITQNTAGQTEQWSYTFKNMPYTSIDGRTVNVYGIEELDIVNYHKRIDLREVAVANSDITNIHADVTNSYKSIDITVKKTWVGVDVQSAPEVHLQLMDVTDAANPVAVGNQVAVLNSGNRFTAVLENLPKYADNGTTLKKYSVVEVPALPGYAFETDTTYSDTPTPDSPDGTALITAKNTRLEQEVRIEKIWVGVNAQNAPNVEVELFDVTDDTTPNFANTALHRSLTAKTLTYSADPDTRFKTVYANLPKYREDGVREIKYIVKENTALPEYNTVITPVNTQSPTVKTATITNTYKTVDITVKKNWEGILPANAPEVRLQLVDATDANNKIPITGNLAVLNTGNGFTTVLNDLPKYKSDGTTRIKYEVMETPDLPGYDFRVTSTYSDATATNSPDGTVEIIATNKLVTQEVKVNKIWTGADPSLAPQITVELFDITADTSADHTQTGMHISLGTKTLRYSTDAAQSFTGTYTNLPKYKQNGTTEIKYLLKERTSFAGYTSTVGEVQTIDAQTKSVTVNNQRKQKNIRFTKSWTMLPEIYAGSTQQTPEVIVDILADQTDDNVVNPTPYSQTGKTTTGIALNRSNQYTVEMDGLNQYAEDGVTEIIYYIKERSIQGYILPADPTAAIAADGVGRTALTANAAGVLEGDLNNTQEKIRLIAEVNWHNLDIYPQSERSNLPTPTVDVWDRTDASNPKRVRANVPLTLTEVPGSNKTRWTAQIDDLPKYTADGTTAIIYQIDQVQNYDGYTTTELTEPKNAGGTVIDIRNPDGSIDSDRTVTTPALRDVTVWEGVIHNTPKTRDVVVQKIWDGPAKNNVSVYLVRNNVRIHPDPTQTTAAPIVITQTMTGQAQNWSYTFENLPYTAINGTTVYDYRVEEMVPAGYSESIARSEVAVAGGVSNIRYEITNSFKSIDITVKKTWTGVELSDAPQVTLQLVDATNNAAPIDVSGKTVTLNHVNNFTQELQNLPKYKDDGVTEIRYSVREVPALAGYTFHVNTTYDNTQTAQSPDGTALIVANNTRVLQEVKVDKVWVGVSPSTAPMIEAELFDVTDDTTANLSDTAVHKSLGKRNLSFHGTDPSLSFTTVYRNLPKYRPDGTTEIRYIVKENTALPEYNVSIGAVNTIDAQKKQVTITNTYKTVDVTVNKTWTNITPAEAPTVSLQLVDATESTKVPVSGKVALLNLTNQYSHTFHDLPKLKPDGITPIVYEVAEVPARAGYRFTQTSVVSNTPTPASPDGTVTITANNTLILQEITVSKVWEGVNASQAPGVTVELLDVTADTTPDYSNTGVHISKGTKTLSFHALNPAESFKAVYQNLPKYKADGQTIIKYLVKERTVLDGYTSSVGTMTQINPTSYSVEIRNNRKTKDLRIQKTFTMADEIYNGFNANKPPVTVDILADVTNNAIVDPTPYTQAGITTSGIVLDAGNSFAKTLSGLHQYAADGVTEIKYYAKERPIQGYTLPTDASAANPADGLGRVALTANASGVLEGNLVNVQETIELTAEVIWNDLDIYSNADRANLPVPHLDVYDRTDPNAPKLVRANVPMTLSVDPASNRSRWIANMDDLPKYTADGSKAIIYSVDQRESYNGYRTTEITDPYNNTTLIPIRDADGNVITDTDTTTPALSGVTNWKARITNTPITREITVNKLWEGPTAGSIQIYLLRDNQRIDANPNATTVSPTVLSATNPTPWSHTFVRMPYMAIDGMTEYDYGVEEIVPAGYSHRIGKTEIPVTGSVANLRFDITNSFKTVDITVKKNWAGNTETTPLSVNLQLVDVTDRTNPIPVAGKIAVLNTGNQFETILADLPKFKADGTTRIIYEAVETPARPGYAFHVVSTFDDTPTQDSAEGTVRIEATNTRIKQEFRIVKNWVGVLPENAPSVEVELFDVTDDTSANHGNTSLHISLGRRTLRASADPNENFTTLYTNLPKYRVDGTTEIVYMVKELTNLPGYTTSIGNVVNTGATAKSVTVTNTRKSKSIQVSKTFGMTDEIYANANDNTPPITVDIYADTTNNNIVDPTPYHQTGIVTQGIVLNNAAGYQKTVQGLEQYMADGVTEIKYYVRERAVRGYILPIDPSAPNPVDGAGRVALVDTLGILTGTIHNVQERVNLVTNLTWNGLENFSNVEIANLPVPHVDVWDITNPAQPKLVRQNQPMTLTEVTGSGRANWTANMNDLPKYTADGSTAIIYSVDHRESYPGYTTTEITNPTGQNGLIDIRNADGSIIADRDVTTDLLANVTTWRADITNTPKLRRVKVVKSWVGPVGGSASIYLKKNNVRIARTPNAPAAAYELNAANQWTQEFVNLPYMGIDGVTPNVYSIEELPVTNYQSTVSMVEEAVLNQVSNLRFDLQNTYKTIDITVKKNWTGVSPADAPQITLQLLDVTDPNAIVEVQNQSIVLNRANQFEGLLQNLPKFKDDGVTPIRYSVKEVPALAGYDFTVNTAYSETATADAPFGTAVITADNDRIKQELKVTKTWEGVNPANAPAVTVELFDVSDDNTADLSNTSSHISLGTRTLAYNTDPAQNFMASFTGLDKYRADGTTEVKYLLKENTNLAGYHGNIGQIVDVDATHKTVEVRNERKRRSLKVNKQWNLGIENYPGANANTPAVTFDILADTTDNNLVDPTPYTQTGVQTTGLVLDHSNRYELTLNGLLQYTDNGLFEIKYYAKENPLPGYTEITDPSATVPADGAGRVALLPIQDVLAGTLVNTRETIDLETTLIWNDLNRFTPADRANLPIPTLRVWDRTDPANPRLVRENIPMILSEDMSSSRARWTANMVGLPKFTADGGTAIIYDVEQVPVYTGFTTTQTTDPYNGNSQIDIRDANGNVLTHRPTTTASITPATVWRAEIRNTPILRDMKVVKTWEGLIQNQVSVYLRRNNQRISPDSSTDAVTPIVIREHTVGQAGTWNYTFENLPYTLIDGLTVANYTVEEIAIPGYTQTMNLREDAPSGSQPGTLHANLHNRFQSVDVTVKKNFAGIDLAFAPGVTLQLVDATDANNPIVLSGYVASLNNANGFVTTFHDLPKFKDDGITRIKYSAIESPRVSGYEYRVQTIFDDTPGVNSADGTVLVDATNTLITRKLKMKKAWEGDANLARPNVEFLLYADSTDDSIDNPQQITQINGIPVDIRLTAANGYAFEMDAPKYAPNGIFETKYYISEVALPGYIPSVTGMLELTLTGVADELGGEIRNQIEPLNVRVTNEWLNMDVFGSYDINDIPSLHITLYDATDPNNPIPVSAEVVLTRDGDGLYKASFPNMPKYKSDGTTPIVYTTNPREVADGSLIGYISTNSGPQTEANGDILIELTQSPRIRKITVRKEMKSGGNPPDVESYIQITRQSQRQNLFDGIIPINTPQMSHTYESTPYFEIDGKTERKYFLLGYVPEGYQMTVDFGKIPQNPADSRFTDLNYVLILKKGGTSKGSGGGSKVVQSGGGGNQTSRTPIVPSSTTPSNPPDTSTTPNSTTSGGGLTGQNRVNNSNTVSTGFTNSISAHDQSNRLTVTDMRGRTITIDSKDRNKYYIDKNGRIVPKTGDDSGVLPYFTSLLGGVTLLFVLVFRRKKEKKERENGLL